ncbi:cytochrome P450 [Trichoderma harzianum]|uniref:Cytochrome P450 n=1 Tax=Trichoderma harzianum TaxID=5544 RepID=A0A0F9X5T5_TRIHA|nr:cytochrome P450 [Trichoderma harzianum]
MDYKVMDSPTVVAASVGALTLVVFLAYRLYVASSRPANFPPGPRGLPIIGNLHQIPQGLPFLAFEEWSKKYGPIVGFKLGSQNAVVIHEASLVHELIIKKGAITSARPPRYVAQEHVIPEGKHIHPVFMRNDYAQRLRSVAKGYLVAPGLTDLAPMARAIGMRLVHDINKLGGVGWADALAQWAVTTPAAVFAGAPVEAFGANFVHDYHQMTIIFEEIMVSGAADIIPILRWVPAMFSDWKRQAPIVRKAVLHAYDTLMRVAKTDHGGSIHGLIPMLLSQSTDPKTESDQRLSETDIKILMGGLLDAGFASTVATFETILLVLLKHPEILKKVQAEIDSVFGSDPSAALPENIDRNDFPYMKACIMEVLRWHAITPIPLPRELQGDVEIRGYHIPKGTTIMTNVWTIQRDPEFYEDPERFEPERYLRNPLGIKDGAPTENRKALYTFGFGRRECPGKEFFFQQMELTMVQVLWAFDLIPTGELDTDVATGFVFGVASRPKVLNMKLVPRRSADTLATEQRKADLKMSQMLGI